MTGAISCNWPIKSTGSFRLPVFRRDQLLIVLWESGK